MAKKQNIKTMVDRILSGNRFNIPPLTEIYRDGEKRTQRENSIDYFTAERALTHNTLFYNSKRERPQIL